MSTAPAKCALLAGTILRRACGAAAMFKCVRCLRAVCETHVRHLKSVAGDTDVCVACMPKASASPDTQRSSSSSSSSGSAFYIDTGSIDPVVDVASWSDNAGGEFGGAGASGGWSDADAPVGSMDAAGFSPEDYAAFDSMAESDKGTTGYDS